MNSICEKLKNDLINAAVREKLDLYKDPFQPKDLKLTASDYGSFSDHCAKRTTPSSKWCGCGQLRRANKQPPYKYILLQ